MAGLREKLLQEQVRLQCHLDKIPHALINWGGTKIQIKG